jgi:hypothetical protein
MIRKAQQEWTSYWEQVHKWQKKHRNLIK